MHLPEFVVKLLCLRSRPLLVDARQSFCTLLRKSGGSFSEDSASIAERTPAAPKLRISQRLGVQVYKRLGVSPTEKSFPFVSFVRARGLAASWNSNPKEVADLFPFPFLGRRAFPSPSLVRVMYKVYELYKVLLPPPKPPIQL